MGIDIGGGGKGGVPQPLLNLLHGDALTEQQTGAAVAQVMEPDVPQAVLLQQEFEMVGDVIGPDQLAHFVGTHIVQVVGAVEAYPSRAAKTRLRTDGGYCKGENSACDSSQALS